MNDILDFGKFIADKRKVLGKTLREMAAELGITPHITVILKKPFDMYKLM